MRPPPFNDLLILFLCVLIHLSVLLQMINAALVEEPRSGPGGDPAWQGRELVAALVSTPGHWVPYLRVQGVWWEVDGGIRQANPFQNQSPHSSVSFLAFRQ